MRYWALAFLLIILLWNASIAQDSPELPAGADYYVEAEVSNTTPYVGEELTYIFRYYAFTLSAGVFDELPDFEGFWLSEVAELITPRVATINNRQYSVMEVYALITPLRSGQLVIEPATLDVPETLFDDASLLETDPVIVDVQPIPVGAPESFQGAVGQFDMSVTISELSTTIGQPITLRVTLNGAGTLERIITPHLPEFEGWRAYQSDVELQSSDISGLRLGEKTFEWLLIPDVAGTQTLQPVEFTYFNPQSQNFVTLLGDTFSIEVFPTETGDRRSTRLSEEFPDALAIFPLSGTLNTESQERSSMFWLLWLVAPLITMSIAGYRFASVYFDQRDRNKRQSSAYERFVHALERSIQLPIDEFSRRAEVILINFVGDKSGRVIATVPEAERILQENITSEGVELFLKHITEAQGLRYSPENIDSLKQAYIGTVADTVRKIDRSWRTA